MADLILPRRFRKDGAVELAPEFFPGSALSFDLRTPNAARNLAQANYGRVLPRAAANWKVGQGGNGIFCNSDTRALLDDAWPNPVVTSDGSGTGDYTLTASISPTAGVRQIAFHVWNLTSFRSLIIYPNAYYAEGSTTSVASSGTLWCGSFDGTVFARGLRVDDVVNGQRLDIVYRRASTGAAEMWINGVLRASNTISVNNVFSTGIASVAIGGWATSTGVAATYPIHTIHVANKLLDGEISENLQAILYKEQKRVIYFDVSSPSFPVLSSLAVSNITSSGARLTAN
jgi:hypothetical protein